MSAMLQMKNIRKEFSGNKVLVDVNLSLDKGEVLALLGENGAGKSTLMKILGGIYTKDGGSILIDNKKVDIKNSIEARDMGISIIHQELMLGQNMTVSENIYMGNEIVNKFGIIDLREQEKRTQKLLDQYKVNIKAGTVLKKLTIAQQQMVEIIKAVSFGAKIIVMDEPTSSLPSQEVDILYSMIRMLKSNGVAIIYISHRLNELYDITDKINVLRDGESVGTVVTKETERQELIKMMVGRDLESFYAKTDSTRDETVLEVRNLADGHRVKDVSFSLKRGEILGFAGLVGAGRSETMECIFGLKPRTAGEMIHRGKSVNYRNSREAMKAGLGLVPEDRKLFGLFLNQGVRFNTTINVLPDIIGLTKNTKEIEKEIVDQKIKDMHIKTSGQEQIVLRLSGGNQQKVLIGRWLCSTKDILILDEPTRGVDVKTKAEIYALIDNLAKEGLSIIMVSSDLPELINMSDRVVVMCNGTSTGILDREELTQENIMTLATKDLTE